jgi:hypothetical protein
LSDNHSPPVRTKPFPETREQVEPVPSSDKVRWPGFLAEPGNRPDIIRWRSWLHAKRDQDIINPIILGVRDIAQVGPEEVRLCKGCRQATLLGCTTYIRCYNQKLIPRVARRHLYSVPNREGYYYLKEVPRLRSHRKSIYNWLLSRKADAQTVFGIRFKVLHSNIVRGRGDKVPTAFYSMVQPYSLRKEEKPRLSLRFYKRWLSDNVGKLNVLLAAADEVKRPQAPLVKRGSTSHYHSGVSKRFSGLTGSHSSYDRTIVATVTNPRAMRFAFCHADRHVWGTQYPDVN